MRSHYINFMSYVVMFQVNKIMNEYKMCFIFSSFRNGMSLCDAASVCPSVRLSVCKLFAQIASSTRQVAGSPPNLHTMVPRWASIQGMLEVKGHVIRALLFWYENRFFSQENGGIADKFAHDGPPVSYTHLTLPTNREV